MYLPLATATWQKSNQARTTAVCRPLRRHFLFSFNFAVFYFFLLSSAGISPYCASSQHRVYKKRSLHAKMAWLSSENCALIWKTVMFVWELIKLCFIWRRQICWYLCDLQTSLLGISHRHIDLTVNCFWFRVISFYFLYLPQVCCL